MELWLGAATACAAIFLVLFIVERQRCNRLETMLLTGADNKGPSLPAIAQAKLSNLFEKDVLKQHQKPTDPELLKKIADQRKAMMEAGRSDLLS